MATDEINDEEDSTDDERDNDDDVVDSDTEKDPIVFASDDEDGELEFESESEEYDDDDDDEEEEGSSDSDTGTEDEASEEEIQRPKTTNKALIKSVKKNEKPVAKKTSKPSSSDEKIKTISSNDAEKAASGLGKEATVNEDEYEHDTSDEEDIRNTVGNIPMQWYEEYPHIGYDWDGKRILKPEKGDQLDNFLKRMEDPDFWRTVKDPLTGQDVVLSEADIELITRIQKQKIPDAKFDEYSVRL